MIDLGDEVEDILTKFKGVATGRAEYLFSPPEIQVQPRQLNADGLPFDPIWIRESRLTVRKESPLEHNEAGTYQS